jgi:hypothetical protein
MIEINITEEILKGNIVAISQSDLLKLNLTEYALKSTYLHPSKIREEDRNKKVVVLGKLNEQEKQVWRNYMAKNQASK